LGLKAARHVGARAICYIPMTHPEATWTTSKLKACLREWLSGFIYRLPDEYITISPRMAQYLHDRHLRQPIVVVPNGVDFASFQRIDRKAARAALGIPHDDVIIGMIGRVDFSQKRHDLALAALAQISGTRKPVRLLVVGEGPDLSRLKQLASDLGLLDRVIFIPWQDNTAAIYPILDMLLLPSAYEGVPLVMLEALFFEVPVVASAIDGMLDMLPSDWLFPSGDATALASRITDLIERDNSLALSKLRSKVLTENSIAEFRRRYAAAVTNAAGEHAPGRDRRLAT
jgi:glycosyltransferase involved in cell wall biosynthesis